MFAHGVLRMKGVRPANVIVDLFIAYYTGCGRRAYSVGLSGRISTALCLVAGDAYRSAGLRGTYRPFQMSIPDEQIFPYATGAAAETVEKHQQPQDVIFYAGWVRTMRTEIAIAVTKQSITVYNIVLSVCSADMDIPRRERDPISVQRSQPL